MITQIGIVAGEIWHHLEEKETLMLSEIKVALEYSDDCILMSLGWLIREGYVIMKKAGNDYSACLRKTVS